MARSDSELERLLEEYLRDVYLGLSRRPPSRNILNEPIPASRLPEPLLPQPFRLRPPARRLRQQRYQEVWCQFDPVPPLRNQAPTLTDLSYLLDDQRFDGVEVKRRRRYVCWRTIQNLDTTTPAT